ncbi:hypothetical protein N7499_006889 [Penicillium canescens]|uniref:NmrA-like domain-containing protein n=1 Tax=Penicillium canescens TaxID=5083 RepID=A0AAD6IED2_PENCN|nr:uncharacterized protein N7446_002577 [Penicillium canescens]KAJ6044385.1 hypothetical protein N7460_005740 [Penicillium canescens]KAJ6055853.1 hypothetical protein N7444_004951 [Penicillium canescens]KAJ6074800.1 hypothetical protein N7446_002577 [Penicillium canescens]KAJ6082015.1 hypothetical protein N7499_006889 [Penicillium canescens]KAJ6176189.1 hypothetical protein N7485_003103 [Penicillium canescens]
MAPTVGIAGVTGKFAQCIIKALQVYPTVSIRGYCRSPHKLPKDILASDKIEIVAGEFDDYGSIRSFVRGSDVVICCYFGGPEVMIQGQKLLIDACEEEGVPRYIASDFAVDYTKIPPGALFPKESAKIIMEYLKSKKVAGVHILTGGLMETFWSEFFGIWRSETCSLSIWGNGEDSWELTTFPTAAAYTTEVALDRSAVGVLRFRGDRKSPKEIKETFERVYGSQMHLDRQGSINELYEAVEEAFRRDPNDIASWAPRCFAFWCTNGMAYLGDNLDNERYPNVQVVNLESFLLRHKMEELDKADQMIGF